MERTTERPERRSRTRCQRRYLLVFVAIGALVFAGGALAQVGGAQAAVDVNTTADTTDTANTAVDVGITTPQSIEAGTTSNATVVASGAENGISTYEVTVAVNDTTVATLGDAEIHAPNDGDGPITDIEPAPDGSALTVTVALLDSTHDPADEIELFDVAVTGQAGGEAALEVAEVRDLADLDADEYDLGNRGETAITVVNPEGTLTVTGPEQLDEGDHANATVSIAGADDGVSTYELTLAVNESDVATLSNVSVHAEGEDGPMVTTDVSQNGSEVTVTAALLDAVHEPADEIDLVDVTITGQTAGTVELAVTDVGDVTSLGHRQYNVSTSDELVVNVGGSSGGGFLLPPEPSAPSDSSEESDSSDGGPAAFELGAIDVPDDSTVGESVSIAVPIENVGGEDGTVNVSVSLDGTVYDVADVAVASGAAEVAVVDVTAPAVPGEYELVVQTADDEATTTLTVVEDETGEEPTTEDQSTDATDDDGDATSIGDSLPGFGVIAALGAVLTTTVFLHRRET